MQNATKSSILDRIAPRAVGRDLSLQIRMNADLRGLWMGLLALHIGNIPPASR